MLQIPVKAQRYFEPSACRPLHEIQAYIRKHGGWQSLKPKTETDAPPVSTSEPPKAFGRPQSPPVRRVLKART